MYQSEFTHQTIKETQIDMLKIIISEGEEVENLLEVNNISAVIKYPLLGSSDLVPTEIGKKHMDQMMLRPNPKLEKTHYSRLYNYVVGDIKKNEMRESLDIYNQVENCIERLRENPFSKRCVITLWSPPDTSDPYALSWTFSQLMIRNGKLIMTNFGYNIF